MKRRVVIIIISIVVFKLILGIIDYRISSSFQNYALITGVVLGIFYLFLRLRIRKWIKVLTMTLVLGGGGFLVISVAPFVVLASEDVDLIDKWKHKQYKVRLTSRQGFSGPAYYRYEIHRPALFGLIHKHIDQVNVSYSSLENCLVDFPRTQMTFDKCDVIIKK